MKLFTYLALCLFLFIIVSGGNPGFTQEKLTADQIMEKVDTRTIPRDVLAEMTMNLINKKGDVRERLVKTRRMGDDKQIMWFLKPANVQGSSFLRLSYEDRDDDMWLYLPAFGKVRRIASHAKKGNFMGSDFTFEDMGERKLKDYTYKLLKEEPFEDKACWVVESIPGEGVNTDYSKIVSWVWKEDYFSLKEEFYDKKGELKKVKTVQLTKLKNYWVPKTMTMKNIKTERRTELLFEKMEVDTGVEESIFSTSYLTRIY